MPIVHVNGGWRWGTSGHVYPTREGAERQAAAAHASGWTGDEVATAAGVMVRAGDYLLFLKRADDSDHPGEWCLPGGGLEVGEDPQSGAVRELLEETGYVADALKEVHRQVLDGVDFTTFAHDAREQFEPRLNGEHTDHVWSKPQDAPQPLHPGVAAMLASMAQDDFNEADHPRAGNGQFGSGGGSPAAKQTPENDPAMVNIPLSKRGNINAQLDKHKAEQARQAEEKRKFDSEQRKTDKATAKELLAKHSEAIHARFDEKFGRKQLSDLLDQWAKWEPKKLIAFVDKFERERAAGKDWGMDELMHSTDKLAFDRASVRTYDQDGRLRVEVANISKATVNPYRGSEIPDWQRLGLDPDKVYQLLRDPAELEAAAPTFNGIPLLDTHVPSTAWDHPKGKVVGTTGTDARFEAPYLKNSLVVWTQEAIDGIESGEQRELSCGYRYVPDMTPGEFEGMRYDGRMTAIKGNHVALVQVGRAGPDVVVGDSQLKEEAPMPKQAPARVATLARMALMGRIPAIAADAKLMDPVFAGVKDAATLKAAQPKIVEAIKPKLAKDADVDGLVDLLNSVVQAAEQEEIEETDTIVDEDPVLAAIKEASGGKLSDEECAALCEKVKAAMPKPAAADTDPPKPGEGGEPPKKDAEDKDMVPKAAMDAALAEAKADTDKRIAAAVAEAEKNTLARVHGIEQAREVATPIVGKLAGAFDSAEGVYRAALDVLHVNHKDIHASALRAVLEAQPKPGSNPRHAMDAAHAQGFAERFPEAAAVRSIG